MFAPNVDGHVNVDPNRFIRVRIAHEVLFKNIIARELIAKRHHLYFSTLFDTMYFYKMTKTICQMRSASNFATVGLVSSTGTLGPMKFAGFQKNPFWRYVTFVV